MAAHDDPVSLSKEVHASEAYRINGRLQLLGVNFFVFRRNYNDLRKILESAKSPEHMLRLWDIKNRRELDAVINEVIRLLHNFLAAAKTLVDHTRVLVSDWYQNTDFLREYEAQVTVRFADNPVSGFIEGLRNYSLHYSLPFAHATLKVTLDEEQQQIASTFALSRSTLRLWANWPSKARPFLDLPEDEISVESLVDLYYQQILDFHSWLEKRLKEIHKEDLEWLSQMHERILNLMSDEEKRERGLT